jgi:Ni/Co efflux regulator RcnB
MQMKKILGILLAVCFLMSVTAAAVSAGPVAEFKKNDDGHGKKVDDKKKDDDKAKKDREDKARKDREDKARKDKDKKFNKGKWIRGHFETKVVKKFIGFGKHHKPIYKYKLIKFWVPGHFVKFNNFHR